MSVLVPALFGVPSPCGGDVKWKQTIILKMHVENGGNIHYADAGSAETMFPAFIEYHLMKKMVVLGKEQSG